MEFFFAAMGTAVVAGSTNVGWQSCHRVGAKEVEIESYGLGQMAAPSSVHLDRVARS